jgi:antitoxin Phd
MTIYTYSQARQKFASILDQAKKKGKILIRRKDGSIFEIKPFAETESPLDVSGVDINISKSEIIDYLKEVRER